MFSLLLISTAVAGSTAQVLESHWNEFSGQAMGIAGLALPDFTAREWDEVAAGGVTKRRIRGEPGVSGGTVDRVIGVALLPLPVEQVWIGILDDVHASLVEGLTERQLRGTTPGHKRLYQALDLPFPLNDRHWILGIQSNAELYAGTGAWERTWSLDPGGPAALLEVEHGVLLSPDDAVWTPENDGGWLLVPVKDHGTLVVYQARTDIGGFVPDDLVARYAVARLDEMITQVMELGQRAPGHYVGDHFPIHGPDDLPLPVW